MEYGNRVASKQKNTSFVTFPITYTTTVYVLATNCNSWESQAPAIVSDVAIDQFSVHCKANGNYSDDTVNWMSIGY